MCIHFIYINLCLYYIYKMLYKHTLYVFIKYKHI